MRRWIWMAFVGLFLSFSVAEGRGFLSLEEARRKQAARREAEARSKAERAKEDRPGASQQHGRKALPAKKQGNDEGEDLILVAVGDVMLAGAMDDVCRKSGYGWPFRPMASFLRSAHVATANLECPLTQRGAAVSGKRWIFRASPEAARSLASAGFDILSLANNHILDYGPQGLFDTVEACLGAGLLTVGAGANLEKAAEPVIVKRFGRRVAFLGFSKVQPASFWARGDRPGAASMELNAMKRRIERARNLADHVVVWFHWGAEYRVKPSRFMRILAQGAMSAGADLVLGGHPHTWGPVELMHGRAVVYSMGNHAFGTSNPKARVGLALRAVFGRKGLKSLHIQPLDVRVAVVGAAPRPARGELRRTWEERFRAASGELGTVLGADTGLGIAVPLVGTLAGEKQP